MACEQSCSECSASGSNRATSGSTRATSGSTRAIRLQTARSDAHRSQMALLAAPRSRRLLFALYECRHNLPVPPFVHTACVPPVLAYFGQKAIKLPIWLPSTVRLPITAGAVFTCWCWLSIAFADVGAYFVGRKFGKNKLGVLSPSLERASPNKSVEGLVGGCVVSAGFGMLGAWVMRWPMWWLNGAVHGVILALLGFVGDLTASLMKRDARLKDFGDLIPEHGGVLDRVDSYIFTAPYAFLFIAFYLPWLKSW